MPAKRLRHLALPFFALSWGASVLHAQDTVFDYLQRDGSDLVTGHSLPLRFSASGEFVVRGATHRRARFNDVPFEISLGAFITPEAVIMVHAEHVADLSGAANYTRFPVTDWPVAGFRGEGPKCHDIPASVVAEEHDLLWLRERGFEPSGAVWIDQHFLADESFNDEVVVSLLARGETCEDSDPARDTLLDLRTVLEVSPARI